LGGISFAVTNYVYEKYLYHIPSFRLGKTEKIRVINVWAARMKDIASIFCFLRKLTATMQGNTLFEMNTLQYMLHQLCAGTFRSPLY
jgi:hypothetical protein